MRHLAEALKIYTKMYPFCLIDSFVATSLVVAAFDYSGGYYNPVLATGLKFGCRGHSHFEHFIVYWIGASLGALASIFAYPPLKNALGVKKLKEA